MRTYNQQKMQGPFLSYAEIHAIERAIDGHFMLDAYQIEILLRFILKN